MLVVVIDVQPMGAVRHVRLALGSQLSETLLYTHCEVH